MCEFIKPPTHFAGDHSRSCWRVCCCRNLLLQKQSQARQTAEDIVNQAHKEADNIKKKLLEAKEENQILREQTEAELRERRSELQRQETRLLQKKKT